MTDAPMQAAFAKVRAAARRAGLPEVAEGTSYGTPALKVRGKSFMRMKDAETVVLLSTHEEKALLLETAPELYYETDHYKGWPAFLVRLAAVDEAELAHRLAQAWRTKAPKRLVKAWDAAADRP